MEAIKKLINIVSELRSPIGGCPWDLEQTHSSLIPYLLEEAHEVADAIRNGSDESLKEELGDLLLQIMLHAQIAKEDNRFNIEDIARGINQKLIRRHPHVFSGTKVSSIEEVKMNWDAIKIKEKPLTTSKTPLSYKVRAKVRSQSPIAGAVEISRAAASAGFEWETIDGVLEKVDEELEELKQAIKEHNISNAQEELGDLMFTIINIARWCNLNAEEGLAGTNKRFLDRFEYIESKLEGNFSKCSLKELSEIWQTAKEALEK